MVKFTLLSYGAVSNDFKFIAQLKKVMIQVKNGDLKPHRLDCYEFTNTKVIENKFINLELEIPRNIEIFYPSDKYPSHIDEGGVSYFIALESGNFYIDGVTYRVVPYVLYAFDDGKLHNTDFCAIMLK
jgi:hypothetical protein